MRYDIVDALKSVRTDAGSMALEDFAHESVSVLHAELRTYTTRAAVIPTGPSALARSARGISGLVPSAQTFLRVATTDGVEGWCGPFAPGSGVNAATLARVWGELKNATSIGAAAIELAPLWSEHPASCAAVDFVLWDVLCRRRDCALWRLLGGGTPAVSVRFYASVLGVALTHAARLLDALGPVYRLSKWTLTPDHDVARQLRPLMKTAPVWKALALDAHGIGDIERARAVARCAPSLGWLEDPFSATDEAAWGKVASAFEGELPRLVTGENVVRPEALIGLSGRAGVYAVNAEVERLGVSRAIALLVALRKRGHVCVFHGRALLPSLQLAVAFPETVQWVEHHLVFAPERLATVCDDLTFEPHGFMDARMSHVGLGMKPSAGCQLQESHTVF